MKLSTPSVYFDGLGISRRAVLDRMGSESLSSMENAAFVCALTNVSPSVRESLQQTSADLEPTTRGLGSVGILEVLAKLGIFLSLLPNKEVTELCKRRK